MRVEGGCCTIYSPQIKETFHRNIFLIVNYGKSYIPSYVCMCHAGKKLSEIPNPTTRENPELNVGQQ